MGIDRTTHLVYGWKFKEIIGKDGEEINPYEEEFLPYVEGHKGVNHTIIHDQMMGEYTVFGVPLGSVSDDGDFVDVGDPELNSFALRNKFKEVFGTDSPTEEPTILLFLHAS